MESRKLTKEDLDKVRDIEGFPIGQDDDIIAISKAPYYTACPNPFIKDFIKKYGTKYDEEADTYHREPFSADVSEGKNDPIYNAHSYHTKVPFKAIMRYILHYTDPGDIVFDGFSGTGMTGVAAQMCGNSLYTFEMLASDKSAKIGTRKAIVSDLSTFASFISHNYNYNSNVMEFVSKAQDAIREVKDKYGWMFEVEHRDASGNLQYGFDRKPLKGTVNYFVWSDAHICPNCSNEFVFWDVAVDEKNGKVIDPFKCPKCGASLKKNDCKHSFVTEYDKELGEVVSIAKKVPVQVNYTYAGKRFERKPIESDLLLLEKIANEPIDSFVPIEELPEGYNTAQPKKSNGIYYVHQFFDRANLAVISFLYDKIKDNNLLLCSLLDIFPRASKMHKIAISRLNTNLSKTAGVLSGTLYIPTNSISYSAIYMFESRITDVSRAMGLFDCHDDVLVSTQSTTDLSNFPENSIDYIFTDPPFGSNLNYSELNYLTEAWLKVKTNNKPEAIMNPVQGKQLFEYQSLMGKCFQEYYRVLKPARWITIEFHNSQNAVWNAIQEALLSAGFVVADVRTLDKKQTSLKQATSTSAVKQDLIISAYKPTEKFTRTFMDKVGSQETAWEFVRQHLSNIPVVVISNGNIELIAERQAYLLYDRMVAYHIMKGIAVPVDSTEFYRGLEEKFLQRDGMYFLANQINEYDTARIKTDIEPIQFSFIVSNEKTAISWLYQQLSDEYGGPKTYADIQPRFMQEVKKVDKYEAIPELSVLLEENFLQDEKGRWYIPDIKKEGDVAKLREKNLLKEFQEYQETKRKLKKFRSEAIRVGFARLWKDKNYQAIVDMAERLPEQTVQEDPNILMYYDISLSRV